MATTMSCHKRLRRGPAKWQAEPTIPLADFDDPVLSRYADRVALTISRGATADVEISELDLAQTRSAQHIECGQRTSS